MKQVIRNAEQLRALRSPVRQQVLEAGQRLARDGPEGEGFSARNMAAVLGMPRESLYYHLNALVDAGFLVASGERAVGRKSERLYRPVADEIMVDPDNHEAAYAEALAEVGGTLLRSVERRYRATLLSSRTDPTAGGSAQLRHHMVRLDPGQAERLEELLVEIEVLLSEADSVTGREYELTVVLTGASD